MNNNLLTRIFFDFELLYYITVYKCKKKKNHFDNLLYFTGTLLMVIHIYLKFVSLWDNLFIKT